MLSGSKLQFLRQIHNITQKELGEELNISKNYISKVENEREPYISEEQVDRWVDAIYKIYVNKKIERGE